MKNADIVITPMKNSNNLIIHFNNFAAQLAVKHLETTNPSYIKYLGSFESPTILIADHLADPFDLLASVRKFFEDLGMNVKLASVIDQKGQAI